MKISVVHPSRNRPERAHKCWFNMVSKQSEDNEIEYILSLDSDEPQIEKYEQLFGSHKVKVIFRANNYAIQAMNAGAQYATGDIIVGISDDFDTMPRNWDNAIVNTLPLDQPHLLKTFDGAQKWICTLPIMNRKLYQQLGYLYNPEYLHMFADTHLSSICDLLGVTIYRNDILFPHNHYTNKNNKDEVNTRNDSTWEQGENKYLAHHATNYGLNPEEIKGTITHVPHLAWITNKLKQKI